MLFSSYKRTWKGDIDDGLELHPPEESGESDVHTTRGCHVKQAKWVPSARGVGTQLQLPGGKGWGEGGNEARVEERGEGASSFVGEEAVLGLADDPCRRYVQKMHHG